MPLVTHTFRLITILFRPRSWLRQLNSESKKELVTIFLSKLRFIRRFVRVKKYLNDEVQETYDKASKCFKVNNLTFYFLGSVSERILTGFNHEINEILIHNIYQYSDVQLRSNDIVLDCGANIGVFTVLTARKVGPDGLIYAFEPGTEEVHSIKKNLNVNKINNAKVVRKAVWIDSSQQTFHPDHSWASKIIEGSASTDKETMTIQATSIDDFVKENKIDKIDFIKMDIEGAEWQALSGAKKTLIQWQPRLAISLYHHHDDYIKLPSLIKKINAKYKFHIKNNVGVLMLYAY